MLIIKIYENSLISKNIYNFEQQIALTSVVTVALMGFD